jgi:hypothetical protein
MPHQLLCRFQSYARRVQVNSKRPSPRMRRSPKARHLIHFFEKHRQATGRESTGPQLDKGPGSLEMRGFRPTAQSPTARQRLGFKKILYATNSGGNICSQSFSLIFDSASAGIHASVSNRSPHFVQDQRLRTKCSLTNSDQSGAISASPHLAHVVVMATLLCLFLFSASRVGSSLVLLQSRLQRGDLH